MKAVRHAERDLETRKARGDSPRRIRRSEMRLEKRRAALEKKK